jgi:DNA modification methylase
MALDWAPTAVAAVPLNRLKPAEWNPRLVKSDRFINLCWAITADPAMLWLRPSLAMEDGTIYAGNMRWRAIDFMWKKGCPVDPSRPNKEPPVWSTAASLAGIEPGMIPAIIEDVPEQVAKERALRDNGAWGEWQDQDLAELLFGLQEQGSDLLTLGFSDKEIESLLDLSGASGEAKEDPGAVDPPATPVTQPGWLWHLGNHRLLCGNSANIADVERLMDGKRAKLIVTDPPYGVDYSEIVQSRVNQKKGGWDEIEGDDADSPEALVAVLNGAFACIREVVATPDAAWYVWHPPLDNRAIFRAALADNGVTVRKEIIWAKPRLVFGRMEYHWQHECCMYGWGQKRPEFRGERTETTLWTVDVGPRDENHPTRKPSELWARACRNHIRNGEILFDGFAGSGPAVVAGEQAGCSAYMIEMKPGFCDSIIERWMAMTGLQATRADGVSYGELKLAIGPAPSDDGDIAEQGTELFSDDAETFDDEED